MRNIIKKKKLKTVFAFCLGMVLSATGVYAATQIEASNVSFTSKSGLKSTNVQAAIDELNSGTCPDNKICKKKICRRATVLHTETCNGNSDTSNCSKSGYNAGSTITYGNLGTTGKLNVGDAFDCDVNGDGEYNPETERFYYVSDWYDTKNTGFNDQYATLIYSVNTVNGELTTDKGSTSIRYTPNEISSGPGKAITWLPSTSQWSNVSVYGGSRQILTEAAGKTINDSTSLPVFSYEGKAARLLTYQELHKGCPSISTTTDGYGNCVFLLENSQFSDPGNWHKSYWLETVTSSSSSNDPYAYYLSTYSNGNKRLDTFWADKNDGPGAKDWGPGVRPVIDVKKENIEY